MKHMPSTLHVSHPPSPASQTALNKPRGKSVGTIARIVALVRRWHERRANLALLDLDDRTLRDIDLTREQIIDEANKWSWRR
jgi:uncharacterized protein YjiS (DUF1127 family)